MWPALPSQRKSCAYCSTKQRSALKIDFAVQKRSFPRVGVFPLRRSGLQEWKEIENQGVLSLDNSQKETEKIEETIE